MGLLPNSENIQCGAAARPKHGCVRNAQNNASWLRNRSWLSMLSRLLNVCLLGVKFCIESCICHVSELGHIRDAGAGHCLR